MKCFNCGKNFDYEKYYGICPKCGSFNRQETAQEQHQRYHDVYDNGYRQNGEIKRKDGRGSTIFLFISIIVFVTVTFGFTALGFLYSRAQGKKLQREVVESEADWEEHAVGESFTFQGMVLTVEEAWVLDRGWEGNPHIAREKKLAAIRLSGQSDGEWTDKNQLSDAYIRHDGFCYWQIPTYEFSEYEEQYGIELFGKYALCGAKECEGCLVFWLDEDASEFTLCLEERADQNLSFIQTIHSIKISLEEE